MLVYFSTTSMLRKFDLA